MAHTVMPACCRLLRAPTEQGAVIACKTTQQRPTVQPLNMTAAGFLPRHEARQWLHIKVVAAAELRTSTHLSASQQLTALGMVALSF
jgi:hypothetical protein